MEPAKPILIAEGVGDVLELYEHKITIKRKGVANFLTKGLQGAKDIYLNQLTALQFKARVSLSLDTLDSELWAG